MNPECDVAMLTLHQMVGQADEARVEAIGDAIETVDGATCADVICALASVLADVLTAEPVDLLTRDLMWCAFQALVLGHLKMHDMTESADGEPN